MRTVVVIPARFASTRLPGKPLADILGKPMIQHVYEKATQAEAIDQVIVATDDERIVAAVQGFSGNVLMTSTQHQSGTDRLVEVMQHIPADIYINVQGDEPLLRPEDLSALVNVMRNSTIQVGKLCHEVSAAEARNPNTVKVVLDNSSHALYFSRAQIPYPRDENAARYLKHIGIYAYRREVLAEYSKIARPMPETAELLEQLRLMAAGIRIHVLKVEPTGPGVDTPQCLQRVRELMAGQSTAEIPSLKNTKLVITDVDGVLTDGGIYYDANGECQKRFHVRDGLGMRLLEENGIRVAILSGRDSPTLRKRVADLGIDLFQFGIKDKATACRALMAQANVKAEQTACIGDDSIDLPAFIACGMSFAVADAPDYVKRQATHVLSHAGGTGAFRELADAILLAQGKEHVFGTAEGYAAVMTEMAQ